MARIEILQIVICMIGSGFNIWGVRDALIVRSILERRRREIEANSMRLSRELTRMTIQLIMITAGLISLSVRGDWAPEYPVITVTHKVAMIAISVLSAYTSIRERIGAHRLLSIAFDERESPQEDRRGDAA
jgi:hypothetical protein